MKSLIIFIASFIWFADIASAQDSTYIKSYSRHSSFRLYYGIDNNNWNSINQLLLANKLDGNFSTISYAFFGFGVTLKRVNYEIEESILFSGQSFNSSNRQYSAEDAMINVLYHYKIFQKKKNVISIYSGINFQDLQLEIDSLDKNSSIGNRTTFIANKYILKLPIGIELQHWYQFKEHNKIIRHELGIRADYNFRLYQSNWYMNNNTSNTSSFNDLGYFECLLFFGFGR